MNGVQTFLVHAIRLESAAAHRSDELADAMQTWGNRDLEAFFRRMAEYSRGHLKEAMARAEEFAAEEREHAAELERVLQLQRQGTQDQTADTDILLMHNHALK